MSHPDRPKPSRHRPTKVPIRKEVSNNNDRVLSAQGVRGEMRFFLQRVAGGLYVEREDVPRRGLQSLQALQFVAADRFHEWCDNDPVRFEYPVLYLDLKRQGDELWGLDDLPGVGDQS